MMKRIIVTKIYFLLFLPFFTLAQEKMTPMVGAELFIEPGQTAQEIDGWCKLMKEHGFTICRIRLFETYMHKADGSWDFSLFDYTYKAAEKYGIKVWGNFFPATDFTDVGGFKFPRSEEHLQSIAGYIKNVVLHFKQFTSHYGWVLINEPGSGNLPNEAFTNQKFEEWKRNLSAPSYHSHGYPEFDFGKERFLVDYNTWFLQWLAEETYKYDPQSHLHVNNHAIFQNVAEYDFPSWRKYLSSLGGSAHASWHFGYFKRQQYTLAMSANCEMIRSGAGDIPWLMTEIQGGNNTYSGFDAMCPTREEITQWLWTVLGSGGKGGIFWCFNPRASGFEAGEWALINFQNQPSDRLIAAGEVAKVVNAHASLFEKARVVESGINILYTRESLWMEKTFQTGGPALEGRDLGGVMKSALSYFEALSEMGIQANLKELNEFDFSKDNYSGVTIILAHQVCIPSRFWKSLEKFVTHGGKLLVDGLTAYYDENAHCIMKTGFPLEHVFGGNVKEFKLEGNLFDLPLEQPNIPLKGQAWYGTLQCKTARSIGNLNGECIASINSFGKGEVFWIPSLIGLAGRLTDYSKIVELLNIVAEGSISHVPFQFKKHQPGMLMKTLRADQSYVTVIINKSKEDRTVELDVIPKLKPTVLFADNNGKIEGTTIRISREETLVIRWD